MTQLMPFDFDSAVIQMVIFQEEGVEIDVPTPRILPLFKQRRDLQQNVGGPVDVQTVQTPTTAASKFVLVDYTSSVPEIVRVETTLIINQAADFTVWTQLLKLIGSGDNGVIFGITSNQQGQYLVRFFMSNERGIVSVSPTAPFVTGDKTSNSAALSIVCNTLVSFLSI